jgi:hypothetical protein
MIKPQFVAALLLLLAEPAIAQIAQTFQCQGQDNKMSISCVVQDRKYMTILTTNGTGADKKCTYTCTLSAAGGGRTGLNGNTTFPVGQTKLLIGNKLLDKALTTNIDMKGTCWLVPQGSRRGYATAQSTSQLNKKALLASLAEQALLIGSRIADRCGPSTARLG